MQKFRQIRMFIFMWFIAAVVALTASMPSYVRADKSAVTGEPAEADKSPAADVIRKFNSALLESMKRAKELGYSGRYNLLSPVIKDSFALPFMASISAGRYWKTLGKKEEARLLEAYTQWTIATYAGRFDDYSGERFDLVSESKPEQGTVTVVSRLIGSDKQENEVDFYYKLRKIEGRWRIVDIQLSGVSQLALTRSQFISVIRDKGFDGLISMLKDKVKSLSGKKNGS
jgi:phospholipid transport system substrate-binding protein